MLRRNLLIYGLGGLIAPFIGIKLIDLLITALGVTAECRRQLPPRPRACVLVFTVLPGLVYPLVVTASPRSPSTTRPTARSSRATARSSGRR